MSVSSEYEPSDVSLGHEQPDVPQEDEQDEQALRDKTASEAFDEYLAPKVANFSEAYKSATVSTLAKGRFKTGGDRLVDPALRNRLPINANNGVLRNMLNNRVTDNRQKKQLDQFMFLSATSEQPKDIYHYMKLGYVPFLINFVKMRALYVGSLGKWPPTVTRLLGNAPGEATTHDYHDFLRLPGQRMGFFDMGPFVDIIVPDCDEVLAAHALRERRRLRRITPGVPDDGDLTPEHYQAMGRYARRSLKNVDEADAQWLAAKIKREDHLEKLRKETQESEAAHFEIAPPQPERQETGKRRRSKAPDTNPTPQKREKVEAKPQRVRSLHHASISSIRLINTRQVKSRTAKNNSLPSSGTPRRTSKPVTADDVRAARAARAGKRLTTSAEQATERATPAAERVAKPATGGHSVNKKAGSRAHDSGDDEVGAQGDNAAIVDEEDGEPDSASDIGVSTVVYEAYTAEARLGSQQKSSSTPSAADIREVYQVSGGDSSSSRAVRMFDHKRQARYVYHGKEGSFGHVAWAYIKARLLKDGHVQIKLTPSSGVLAGLTVVYTETKN